MGGGGDQLRAAAAGASTSSDRRQTGAKLTLSLTPVLCDQLEAPGALERCVAFLDEIRAGVAPTRHRRVCSAPATHSAVAELERSAAEYASAAEALDRLDEQRRTRAGARPARDLDLLGHPRDPAAAGARRVDRPAGAGRHRLAPSPVRRVGRRLLAARVRPRALAQRPAARGGHPRHCVEFTGLLGLGDRAKPAPTQATRRTDAVADRPHDRRPHVGRERLSVAARLQQPITGARLRDHHLRANDGSRLRPRARPASGRGTTPANSSPWSSSALPTAGSASARSTPSFWATGGMRGRSGCEAVLAEAERQQLTADRPWTQEAIARHAAARSGPTIDRACRTAGVRAATFAPGVRRPSPTSPGRPARAEFNTFVHGRRRTVTQGAPRTDGAPSPVTGRFSPTTTGPATTRGSVPAGTLPSLPVH